MFGHTGAECVSAWVGRNVAPWVGGIDWLCCWGAVPVNIFLLFPLVVSLLLLMSHIESVTYKEGVASMWGQIKTPGRANTWGLDPSVKSSGYILAQGRMTFD